MDNMPKVVNRISTDIEKDVVMRLCKIIGQLKSVAAQLDECPRDLSALTQFAAANAATGSLMRLIAKDIMQNTLDKEVCDDDATCYLKEVVGMLIDDSNDVIS